MVAKRSYSFLAELFASLAITYTASVAISTDRLTGGELGPVGQAIAVGAVTTAVVTASARRSPGLGNPAIALALLSMGRLSIWGTVRIVIAQLIGAVMGALLARGLFPIEVWHLSRGGTPQWHERIGFPQAVTAEFTLGFLLIWTLLSTTRLRLDPDGNALAIWSRPLVTGGITGLLSAGFLLIAGPVAGGLANPARAFGPAVASGFWDRQAAYWLGPILGGWLAAVMFNVCFRPR